MKWTRVWASSGSWWQTWKPGMLQSMGSQRLGHDGATELNYVNLNTHMKVKVLVTQSCLTLCDLMDCSPPGSSVHGILQARILEWVAISFSRGLSQPRDWTWVSCISGRFFTNRATRAFTLKQLNTCDILVLKLQTEKIKKSDSIVQWQYVRNYKLSFKVDESLEHFEEQFGPTYL